MFQDAWVIRDSNRTIKMVVSRHLDNASKIIVECIVLRDGVLVAKNNGFLDLEIEGDCKVIINYTL